MLKDVIWKFISEHKTHIALVLAGVGLYFLGYNNGQGDVRVVTTEKVVVQERETLKVVEVEKIIKERNTDTSVAERIHKERYEETRPDGTKIVKETTDINVDKTVKEIEVQFVDRTNTIEKEVVVEKQVEVVKEVEAKLPDWTVTARLGTDISEFKPQLTVPYFSPLIVGAEVDRRIVGPFKAGLWVQTTTQLQHISGGLAVGMEF